MLTPQPENPEQVSKPVPIVTKKENTGMQNSTVLLHNRTLWLGEAPNVVKTLEIFTGASH
jgi:hypothetical protein